MKKLKKKLLNSQGFRVALSYVIAAYIRFVLITSKREYVIPEEAQAYCRGEKQAITAFWHGRLLLMPDLRPPKRSMNILVSAHRDGLIISETMNRFTAGTIVGSSTRGSISALKNIFSLLKQGSNIAITPDGPKGPFQVAAAGVAHICARSGVPTLPMAFSSSRHKRVRSWDRFFLALPFTKIVFVVGSPISGEGMEIEALRQKIETNLNEVTAQADRLAGVAS